MASDLLISLLARSRLGIDGAAIVIPYALVEVIFNQRSFHCLRDGSIRKNAFLV